MVTCKAQHVFVHAVTHLSQKPQERSSDVEHLPEEKEEERQEQNT